jgi:DNA-binding LacI/PurR family transcriptional regulator
MTVVQTTADGEPPVEREDSARRASGSDVARRAGVSRATVSYVLNNAPNRRISDRTRQIVLDAAAELGHFPNAGGRALRAGRSEVVLALVPGYTVGLFYGEMLDRLDDVLTGRGYGLLVHRRSDSRMSVAELWGLVNPELVIAVGGLSADELTALQRSPARLIRMDNLLSHVDVGRMQAEYLIDRGHTRLGFAQPSDPALRVFAAGRLRGISEVCNERGLAPPDLRVVELDADDAQQAVLEWRRSRVTAVCAHNDDLGLVILAALRGMGWTKDDLALIGADDLPMASFGLTTIRFRRASISDHLVASVLAALDDETMPEKGPVAMEVVERESA